MNSLDAVDAALLRALQADGRATIQTLADQVGLSRTAARARLNELLDHGVVRVVGVLHAQVAGVGAMAHVAVAHTGDAGPLVAALLQRRATTFIAKTAGQFGLAIELRVGDDEALLQELDHLRCQPNVRWLDVVRTVHLVKDTHSAVSGLDVVALDGVDWKLVAALQADGRESYTQLARRVSLSQAATRARVMRLLASGSLHISVRVDADALGVRDAVGIGLRIRADAKEVAAAVAAVPGVSFVMIGLGSYDIMCSAAAASRLELLSIMDAVRRLPAVVELASWYYLDVLHETFALEQEHASQ